MANSITVITELSRLYWAHIVAPGVDNYEGDAKEFKITAVQDAATANVLKTQIDALYAANTKDEYTCKTMAYKPCTATGRIDKTGDHYSFTARTKTEFEGRATVIKTYDASGKRFDMGDKQIGNGSMGAIECVIRYYWQKKSKEDGISIFLRAVQVKELVPYVKQSPKFVKHQGFVGVATEKAPEPSGFADHSTNNLADQSAVAF